MLFKKTIIICFFPLFFASCGFHPAQNEMTQLEIREIQTHIFKETNPSQVLKEMINVLQDDDFIVKNANAELGFLQGEKEVDMESRWHKALSVFAGKEQSTWIKNQILAISANISQFGTETRVRINIQKKVLNNLGHVVEVYPVYDTAYYQKLFNKIHKGLFIQQEQL